MFNYEDIKKFNKAYIIAEIGANHNGNMDLALKMIRIAKDKGADCVKFQSWTKNSVFSKVVYQDNHFLKDDYRDREDFNLEQIVEAYQIGKEEHFLLKNYCDEIGIDFNSTPFSPQEVDLLVDELQVPFIKIASMDLTNIPFLKYVAKKGVPIVISTGLCGLSDVDEAITCLEENGCFEIIILHCVSLYPPKDEEMNLNNIDMFRTTFGYPVGYSDHTLGVVAPILSMAKGACIIEKHFTLDKEMEGWDHKVSADPEELGHIVEASKVSYKMLGTYRRKIVEDQERRNAFQRSIVATRDINVGEIIKIEDIDYKRPGTGISPKFYQFVVGQEAKKKIEKDEIINREDI